MPQQTRDAKPVLFECWATVADGGPTLKQHWLNVSCLLDTRLFLSCTFFMDNQANMYCLAISIILSQLLCRVYQGWLIMYDSSE